MWSECRSHGRFRKLLPRGIILRVGESWSRTDLFRRRGSAIPSRQMVENDGKKLRIVGIELYDVKTASFLVVPVFMEILGKSSLRLDEFCG